MNERIRKRLPTLAKIALLVGAVVVVYWPARHGGFILDDDYLLTENPLIKSPAGWHRFWSTEATDFWPVTNDALWVQWRLWGLDPTGYHVVNILLQMANALLIWKILSQLRIPGAYWAALLFAVHPVNVESVAWIAQIKNGLSLWFFLLSILWHLKGAGGWNRWYALSLAAFALAGLSKGSVLILPLVLLLIAWWQKGRIGRGELTKLAPYFAVAATLAVTDIWFQTHGSGVALRTVTMAQRLAGAGAVVWFYLGKAVAPIQLSFVYPQWEIRTDELRWWLPLAAASLVTALLWWQRNSPRIKWVRPTLFVWLFFCVALLPVMGLTDVGFMKFSLVADHYQQIALIAVVALAAAGGTWLANRWNCQAAAARWMPGVMALLFVAALATLSFAQCQLYADPVVLYEAAIKATPNSWLLENNLGLALSETGKPEEAILHFQRALAIDHSCMEAQCNWAAALVKMGQPKAAIEHFQAALAINPNDAKAHHKLADLLLADDQNESALQHYQTALRLKPDDPDIHYDLGLLLAGNGQLPAAIEHFQNAARLDPSNVDTLVHLGIALAMADRLPEAQATFEQIVREHPENPEGYFNLALAHARLNRRTEALTTAHRALELARSQKNDELAKQIETWLSSFEAAEQSSTDERAHP